MSDALEPTLTAWGRKVLATLAQRMCPNVACERYGQPTRLLGGCDCGTALVAYKAFWDDKAALDALAREEREA